MARLQDIFQLQTLAGKPTTVGDVTVTPQSQALTIRWPFGGFVWNRPVAVLVKRGEQIERMPIVDVTRVAQLGLFGLSLVFSVIILLRSARPGRGQNE